MLPSTIRLGKFNQVELTCLMKIIQHGLNHLNYHLQSLTIADYGYTATATRSVVLTRLYIKLRNKMERGAVQYTISIDITEAFALWHIYVAANILDTYAQLMLRNITNDIHRAVYNAKQLSLG